MKTLTGVTHPLSTLAPADEKPRFIVVDGFGQPPNCLVTWELATGLRTAFPHADVLPPIPTAETLSDDTTLQIPFSRQEDRFRAVLTASDTETHVVAHSQGCIPVASVLCKQRYRHVASVTFIGTPFVASRELARVADLDASATGDSDMGNAFDYVCGQLPPDDAVSLAGVVLFRRADQSIHYVGVSEQYTDSFPSDSDHYRWLAGTMRAYRTTLVGLGAESVTDCTPERVRLFVVGIGMTFAEELSDLNPERFSQGIVIPDAPHRMGHTHRTVTVPDIIQRRAGAPAPRRRSLLRLMTSGR